MNLCLLSTQMDHHFIIENLPITEISERYRPYLYHAALISSTCKFSFSFFLCIYWTNGTVEKSKVKRTGKSTSSTAEMKPPFSSPTSSSVLRKARFSPYLFTLLAFIVFVAVLYGEDFSCIVELGSESDGRPIGEFSSHNALTGAFFFPIFFFVLFQRLIYDFIVEKRREKLPFAIGEIEGGRCDVFSGMWVRDESNRPLYEESDCPYIQPQLTCQEHGRPEKEYQFWRWKPHDCSLPK